MSGGGLHFWQARVPELRHVHGEEAVAGGNGGGEPSELIGEEAVEEQAQEKRSEQIHYSPSPPAEIRESSAGQKKIAKECEPGIFHASLDEDYDDADDITGSVSI